VRTGAEGRFSLVVPEGEAVRFVLARDGEGGAGKRALLRDVAPGSGPLRLVLGEE
jgi:hypothetical protein